MNTLRRRHHLASWIALVAVLLLSLAPTLVRAWHQVSPGGSSPSSLIEVCSAQGTRWVAVPADDGDKQPSGDHATQHCPWCVHHAPTLGLPPAAFDMSWPSATAHAMPPAFLHAPRTLHAWRGTQPRAPPRLS